MRLFAAPMQGYTEAMWRRCHHELYGPADVEYIAPFVRIEKGEPRVRDMRDNLAPHDAGMSVEAQLIFRDAHEFRLIAERLYEGGCRRMNLNMGCPFVPQCRRGRGAAVIGSVRELGEVAELMRGYGDVRFSVKMRLGHDDAGEWRRSVEVLNAMPLDYVAVHPRTAADQYGGPLRMADFSELMSALNHPVVYNGELRTPADIDSVLSAFPGISGVMAGRGLVARPSLFAEWASGEEWSEDKRRGMFMRLHDMLAAEYEATLCGQAQILSKLKPFWDYADGMFGHKTLKAIRKATTMQRYREALPAGTQSLI